MSSKGLSRRFANSRLFHEQEILAKLEVKSHVSQRALSSELGIALGLTNLVMRRMVQKGWVRIKRVSTRRLLYLITPAGIAAKAELSQQYFLSSLASYRDARGKMLERMRVLFSEVPSNGAGRADVVFYGTGDAAEVAYVCLPDVGLELSGVVGGPSDRAFFHLNVQLPSALEGLTLCGRPFSRLVVMPLQDKDQVREVLAAQHVPSEYVFWL